MVQPITPDEAVVRKGAIIPDFVIESFNELIAENLTLSGRAVISQDDVVSRILSKCTLATDRQSIYERKWLDVEPLYRAAGWHVVYDKPAYYESYEPTFTFTKPTQG